jgi:3-deoxy-D-manno-octulosonate 8-phosphate phosphatase KdsC-like HAD superfamily phosphatase
MDACEEVKKCIDYVPALSYGRDVVRKTIELIVKAKDKWNSL